MANRTFPFAYLLFLTSLFWYPQYEQVSLLGYIVGTLTTLVLYHSALYSSILKNLDYDTEATCFATYDCESYSLLLNLQCILFGFHQSVLLIVFVRHHFFICVTFSWILATFIRCLLWLIEPFTFLKAYVVLLRVYALLSLNA